MALQRTVETVLHVLEVYAWSAHVEWAGGHRWLHVLGGPYCT